MKPRYYLAFLFLSALVLILATSIPPSAKPPTQPSLDGTDAPVEHVVVQVEAEPPVSVTTEPNASQMAPQTDGESVLESHCARCHPAQWIEATQKSRPEWEETLARMEGNGVLLSEAEKIILLDYLAQVDGAQDP